MPRRAYSWQEFFDGLQRGDGVAYITLGFFGSGALMAVLIWISTNKHRETPR